MSARVRRFQNLSQANPAIGAILDNREQTQ